MGEGRSINDGELILCSGSCLQRLPQYYFFESDLAKWISTEMIGARCVRCTIAEEQHTKETVLECGKCELTKHVSKFSSLSLKRWKVGNHHHYAPVVIALIIFIMHINNIMRKLFSAWYCVIVIFILIIINSL